jgi:hypothetical protein
MITQKTTIPVVKLSKYAIVVTTSVVTAPNIAFGDGIIGINMTHPGIIRPGCVTLLFQPVG